MSNTRVWRAEKLILREYNVFNAYISLWRKEKQQYQTELREKLRLKVSTLIRRYSSQEAIPESVRGIVIEDQQVPEEFSTGPKCYGGVEINMDEQAVLSLPPKYAVYSKIDVIDCEAQVEKSLAKLRWSVQKRERQEEEGTEQREDQKSFKAGYEHF